MRGIARVLAFLGIFLIVGARGASAGTYSTTVSWGGGGCTICGASYACSNGAGNWNGGNQTFVDPSGGVNGQVVSVTVTVNMINCSGGVNTATLDGTFVGNWSGPAQCACGSCDPPAVMTQNTPGGFPGYVYGGVNTLNIAASILVCVANATITVTTANPVIAVAPGAINFGNQRVATTSGPQTVTISNTGTSNLTVNSITLGGANPGDFSLVNPVLPATIAPNGSTTFQASFTPTTVGARAATVTITNNSVNSPNATVSLTGNGIQPTIAVAPGAVSFGNQRVATTSAGQTITITNTGTDNLKVSTIALGGANPGDFALVGLPGLPDTIAPNGTATFQATFTPTAAGARNATVTITSDAGNNPSVVVPLTGNGIQPTIAVAPGAVNFGNQRVATTSAGQTITITNTGTDNLKVSAIALGGANPGDFALAGLPGLPATIAPNGTAMFQATFTPTAAGARNATVTIVSDAANAPSVVVPLTGNGVQPTIAVAPGAVNFGNQRVATTSAGQTITITNTGTDNLKVSAIALGGANPGDFALAGLPGLPDTIAPNGTATFQATFTPTAVGARNATVTIVSDAANAPSVVVPLTGNGIQPSIAVAPGAVPFGNQRVATTSAPQTITITNTGTDNLKVSAIALGGANPGDFALAGVPALPATLAPNGSAMFQVTFTPTATGARSATVTIASDAANAPSVVVPLTGTGVQPTIAVAPGAVNFGNQRVATTSAPQTITLTNTGTDNLQVTAIGLGGANPGDFALAGVPVLPTTIAPNGTAAFQVTFTPTATGARTAAILILSNAANTPSLTVALNGNGTQPSVAVAPNALSFGNQRVATMSAPQSITISNTGSDTLNVSAIALGGANPGDFALGGLPGLPAAIPPNATVAFQVTFTPSATGPRNATVTITSDAANSPSVVVPLSGNGIQPLVAVAPPSVNFGNQRLATTSAPQSIVISNGGSDNLKVSAIVLGGANPGDFALAGVPVLPATIPPNGTATFQVTFTPTALGARAAAITITSDAANSPTVVVPLSGNGVQVTIAVAPNALSFGNQRVATTSAPQSITLSNTGTDNLTVSSIVLGGANPGDFALAGVPVLPAIIAPNGTAVFQVTFSPTVVGARNATVTITSDAANTPSVVVPLSGTGIQATIAVAPNALAFGTQRVGTTSAAQTLTLTNTGSDNLKISTIVLGGANPGDYALAGLPALPATLAPNGTAAFQVTFSPTAVGARNASVVITSDANNSPTLTVPLTGTGAQPNISVTPPALAFGNVRVGNTSATKTVTISNTGTDVLNVSAIALGGANPGDFVLSGLPPLPAAIPANASATFLVAFAPTAAGARSGSAIVSSDAPNTPTVTVPLTGTGIQPTISVAPNAIAFGNLRVGKTSAPQTITFTNTGTDNLNVSAIALGGANAGDFALAGLPNLPFTLAANGSASFQVTFTPTAVGARSGDVVITSDAANQPTATVPLTGTGIVPSVALAPQQITFPDQRVATTSPPATITISNTGTDKLTVLNIMLSGANAADFATVNLPMLPAMVAPGGNLTFAVDFTPSVVGPRVGQAVVQTDDPNTPSAQVALSGNGIAPQVVLTPMALDFGKVPIGTSPTKDVVLSNTGTDALALQSLMLSGSNNFTLPKPPMLPASLAPGASLTLTIAYTPNAIAVDNGKLTLVTDNPKMPNFEVTLTGQGVSGAIDVSPTMLDFGAVAVGKTSPTQDVKVSNTGQANFTVTSAMLAGNDPMAFVLPNQPVLPQQLVPGGSLTIHVAYAPTMHAPQSATLHIVTDLPNNIAADVPLTGMGLEAGIGASPTMLDFGTVVVGATGGPLMLTLRNTGDAPLDLDQPVLSGTGAPQFSVQFTPPGPLAPGMTATALVSFSPMAAGSFTAMLTAASTDPKVPPVSVPLTGMGIDARLDVSPLSLDFKTVALGATGGPQTVTIRNPGTASLTIAAVTSDAVDFQVSTAQLMTTLAPGGSTSFDVTFRPSAAGMQSANIVIDTSLKKGAATVTAIGNGSASVAGGGCACQTGARARTPFGLVALLAGLCLALARRRRR
jgi:hypothetical protein